MNTSEFENLLREFFAETCPPELVQQIEDAGPDSPEWNDLWGALVEMDLPRIGIDEARGGAGGGIGELVTALRVHGRAAVPSPLAATQIALWAIAEAGTDPTGLSEGLTVFAYPDPRNVLPSTGPSTGEALSGSVHAVPWGRIAATAVLPSPDSLLVVDTSGVRVAPGTDLAGMPLDTLHFDAAPVARLPWPHDPSTLTHRAMLSQAALISGALEEITALTIQYVQTREQFGRPLGKFQSVQQHIVHLQQMSTMSALAVDRAAIEFEAGNTFAAAMAKAVVNENAIIAVRAAHQAHGAMGMTREYRLQLLTRRVNAWIGYAGSRTELGVAIGEAVAAGGLAQTLAAN